MTKLNLLGAQRVKALTEILERRYKDAIRDVQNEAMSSMEAVEIYAEKIGKYDLYERVRDAEIDMANLRREAREIGVEVDVKFDVRFYSMPEDVRKEIQSIRNNGVDGKVARLKRELEDKKSQLWLVEMLEQAQDIVNSEIKID